MASPRCTGCRRIFLQAQAEAIGLPLRTVALSSPGLQDYVEVMSRLGERLYDEGIRAIAFGDLEHSGAPTYRESLFGPLGLAVVQPLWGMTSAECIADYLQSGIEAIIVVVDASALGVEHLGRPLDRAFVDGLPQGCDPCGEFGEYHSFVAYAPYFRRPVRYEVGASERIERQIGTCDGIQTFSYWLLHVH